LFVFSIKEYVTIYPQTSEILNISVGQLCCGFVVILLSKLYQGCKVIDFLNKSQTFNKLK